MISTILVVAMFGFSLNYFINYRDWSHWNQKGALPVRPGPCQVVHADGGSEDIVYVGDGIFLMSTGFQFGTLTGDIIGLDVNGTPRIVTVNRTDVPDNEEPLLASAAGVSSWRESASGRLFLYVSTHPPDEDKIRVFEVLKPLQIKYIKTISDPSFTFMNNLVVVGLDKFYATKYTCFRHPTSVMLEHFLHLRQGKILYYDGTKAREVSSGYFLPNGINVSPDKKMLYMAEWGGQRLHGFKIDSAYNLIKAWDVAIDAGLDNIDVDDNGDLWIGTHPVVWQILDFWNVFGSPVSSQVIRVKIRDNAVDDIEVIYADDGRQCSLSTVASYRNGKLVIGTLFKQTVVCDVNNLTK